MVRSSATRLVGGIGHVALGGGSPAVTVQPPRRVILYAVSNARVEPAISMANSTPPRVASFTFATTSGSAALKECVAPSSRASFNLSSERSTATTVPPPHPPPPRIDPTPTPPTPTTPTQL